MIFSNADIREALRQGTLVIDPHPDENMYSTSAVDLRLGNVFNILDDPDPDSGIFVTVGTSQPEAIAERYGIRREVLARIT